MKKIILIAVIILSSCNTSKKVAINKIGVDKSIIEQESFKQEENARNSINK